jgi:putative membrane protein
MTEPATGPTLDRLLALSADPVSVVAIVGVALGLLYLAGAGRMWASGRRWSIARTMAFLAGCGLIVVVTATAADDYGQSLFSVFMFQQLTLMLVVPPLLVVGAPGTLLLRATPHSFGGQWVLRAALFGLRSRLGRTLIHPAFTLPVFLFVFYGLYLGGLADPILAIPAGHTLLELLFVGAGILFAVPVLSPDPVPGRHSALGRVVEMFTKIALHTAFGVILLLATAPLVKTFASPPAGWGIDPLYDQQIAGALVWTYAELPSFIILIYLLNRWYRDSTRRDRAADRRADAAGDPDLAAYNAHLEQLNRRPPSRPPGSTDPHPVPASRAAEPKQEDR